MPMRNSHACWEGTLKDGKGQVDFGNGLFNGAYSFASRFEDGKGTNPEELLGPAHASCFAMALSLILGEAGFRPDYLVCEAKVPGIEDAQFKQHAAVAKAGCPVSQALAGTEITLEARLLVT